MEYYGIRGTGAENGEHGAEIERKNEPVKRLPTIVTFSLAEIGTKYLLLLVVTVICYHCR